MEKKQRQTNINIDSILKLLLVASTVVLIVTRKRQKTNMEQAVLDASSITGKPLAVNEKGELVLYAEKK